MPVTPFGQLLDAAQMARLRQADAPRPAKDAVLQTPRALAQTVSKWDMLREITAARKIFGLSDRDLTVLQALISFFPGADLNGGPGEMIVHPSNAAICARLNGMPDSTMRRHLTALVDAGLLTRRDSPNGKRYIRRGRAGGVAFGFDLWPLVARRQEIIAAAEAERLAAEELHSLRESVSLMRRDLAALIAWGQIELPALPLWTRLGDLSVLSGRTLRRKPERAALEQMETVLSAALAEVKAQLAIAETTDLSSNVVDNEQHIQNSDKDLIEYRSRDEAVDEPADGAIDQAVPLRMVLAACGEVQTYSEDEIRSWRDLVTICETVRPMMGVSPDIWHEARNRLGAVSASVVLAAMLERIDSIRSPGAYLRHLLQKASSGKFSPAPMVMALMRRAA